jgi:hypothetical protein
MFIWASLYVHKAIEELLELTGALRKLQVDTTVVRLDLDRLLRVYGRRWAEMPRRGDD